MLKFLKGFLFLTVCFLSVGLGYACDLCNLEGQQKIYIKRNNFEIVQESIYVISDDYQIETKNLRIDEQGLFIYEDDMIECLCLSSYEKKWKCPYCYHWWDLGERCENPDCPTNNWPKEGKEKDKEDKAKDKEDKAVEEESKE